jgi:hypothetical protein
MGTNAVMRATVEGVGRRRTYFWLMGTCIGLIVLAWNVVRFFSIPLAVGMSVVAAVIPPAAAIVANWSSDGTDNRHDDGNTPVE